MNQERDYLDSELDQIYQQIVDTDPTSSPDILGARHVLALLNRAAGGEAYAETAGHRDTATDDTSGNLRQLPLPERIGRFEIRQKIAEGGFGVVYKAYDSNLNREVALKLPKNVLAMTADSRQRFVNEGRAVALLSHPNIVPVFDAGREGPVFYIASQLIAGETLADWLSSGSAKLDATTAARWMASLSDAVGHAHQRGILHRDLKPGNVLIETGDHPSDLPVQLKITDFGLAKNILEPDQTTSGQLIGTPAYMSPEQAQGKTSQITTLSDIYSLGAIFYELLTGQPPFGGDSFVQTLDAVRQQDPKPPRALRPDIPADCEAICLKCLEKDPHRRYQTAEELKLDLLAFIHGEPVAARPIGTLQRWGRWAARNPLISGLCAAIVVVSVAGMAWVLREKNIASNNFQLAEANFEISQNAVEDMLSQVGHRLQRVPGAQTVSRDILRSALEHFQVLSSRKSDDPIIQHQTATAYLNIARIHLRLDEVDRALESAEFAIDLMEPLVANHPRAVVLKSLAKAHSVRSQALAQNGRWEESIAAARAAIDTWDHPSNEAVPADRAARIRAQMTLAGAMKGNGEFKDAMIVYASIIDRLVDNSADNDPMIQQLLAGCFNNLGILQSTSEEEREIGKQNICEAVNLLDHLAKRFPDDLEILQFQARTLHTYSKFFRGAEFEKWLARVIKVRRHLSESFPAVPEFSLGYSVALGELAREQEKNGELDLAWRNNEEVCLIQRRLSQQFPNRTTYKHHLGSSLNNLGQCFRGLGRYDDAIEVLLEAELVQSVALKSQPDNRKMQRALFNHRANLAITYLAVDQIVDAAEYLQGTAELSNQPKRWYLVAQLYGKCINTASTDIPNEATTLTQPWKLEVYELLQKCLNDTRFNLPTDTITRDGAFSSFHNDERFLAILHQSDANTDQ